MSTYLKRDLLIFRPKTLGALAPSSLHLYVHGRFGFKLTPNRNYNYLGIDAKLGVRMMDNIDPAKDSRSSSRYGAFVSELNAALS